MAVTAADARTVDKLLSAIRDGGQPKYLLFWGHQPPPAGGTGKDCLSQSWPAAFTVDGVSYPTAEHYMMAAKARLSGDTESAAQILAAPHPGAAKALGRQVRGFDEQRWEQRRFDVVVAGNLAKFGQPQLRTSWPAPAAGSWSRLPRGPDLGHRADRRRRAGPVAGTLAGAEPARLRTDGSAPPAQRQPMTAGHSPLTAAEVIAKGGWHPRYARVIALASDDGYGFALVDGNGDGSELEAEAWAWRDGAWHGSGSSGRAG